MKITNQNISSQFESLLDNLIINFLGQYELEKSENFSKSDHFNFKIAGSEKSIKLPGRNNEIGREYVIHLYSIFSIAAYELLCTFEHFDKIADKPEVLILKHVRNSSLNNNYFILDKETLPSPLIWIKKKLTIRRNGKECFFKFLGVSDICLLYTSPSPRD